MIWLETSTLVGGFVGAMASVTVSDTPLKSMADCYAYLDLQEERYHLPSRDNKSQLVVKYEKDNTNVKVIRTCLKTK